MKIMTAYHNIERFLSDTFGFDPELIGRRHISDAVKVRIKMVMTTDEDKYLEILKSDSEELDRFVEQIVVPETWFFRDRESFNFLKKNIDESWRTLHSGKTLRILSVPCSTGEEPYSIAMVLLEAGLSADSFRIDAVDVSRKALKTAKKAVYGKGSFRGEKKSFQDRYFTMTKDGYELGGAVKGLVHFYHENFIKPYVLKGHEPYQIIFCKNLLIYLTDDARNKVFFNLERLLSPGGVIFTGHSEMMSFLQKGYKPFGHSRSFACRKTESLEIMQSAASTPPLAPPGVVTSFTTAMQPAETERAGSVHPHSEQPTPESVLARVRKLADRGKLDEAMKLCGQFLEGHSDNKEAYYLMGLINLALDYFASAEDYFQKALYLDPYYYEALLHMNLLYEKRGEMSKAFIIKERMRRFT